MPKDLSTDEAFTRAILDQVEGNAPAESDEPSPEPIEEEKPRDEKGQFVKKEDGLVFGKFKNIEEAEKSYHSLEQLLGKHSQELGELRQKVLVNTDTSWLESALSENPQGVAQWALENKNPVLYEQAMDYWYTENPKNAGRFEMQAFISEERGRWESGLRPLSEEGEARNLEAAFAHVASKHSDVSEKVGDMLSLAQERPWLVTEIKSAAREQKAVILEDLYLLASSRGKPEQPPATPAGPTGPREIPYVETGGSIPEQGPRDAKTILREQIIGTEAHPLDLHPLDKGIRRQGKQTE